MMLKVFSTGQASGLAFARSILKVCFRQIRCWVEEEDGADF